MQKFNSYLALRLTNIVGSMNCAYLFCVIALISLPSAISTGSLIIIISWVAQTFLQLVLLSVIMVGQNIQSSQNQAKLDQILAKIESQQEEELADLSQIEQKEGLVA